MAINTQKLLPSSSSATSASIAGDQNRMFKVKTTVIDIEKILKGTIALQKKELDVSRKEREEKKFRKKEEDLEKKKYKEDFKIKLPTLPKLGFLDWVKNFVVNTLVGYFVVRLIKYLPQFQGIFSIAGKALDGVTFIGGKLLDGLVTFIDWGYKAYDATRGFLNQIGGDNTLNLFDKFTDGLDKFLTLVLGYNALSGGTDIIGKSIGKIVGGAFGRLGIGLGIGAGGRLSQAKISQLLSKGIQKIPTTSQAQANLARSSEVAGLSQVARTKSGSTVRVESPQVTKLRQQIYAKELENIKRKSFLNYKRLGYSTSEARRYAEVGIEGKATLPGTAGTSVKLSPKKIRPSSFDPASREAGEAILENIRRGVEGRGPRLGGPGQPSQKQAKILQRMTKPGISQQAMMNLQEELARIGLEERGIKDYAAFKKLGIDVDPKKLADAQADAGLARLMGGDIPQVSRRMSPTKIFLRQARGIFSKVKIPIIGGLLDFGIQVALGEDPGRAAFKAIGAGLLGAVGGVIGSVIPVAGNLIGGAIGGIGGDYLGGLLYDAIFGGKKTSGGKTQGFAGGGQATRAGKTTSGPTSRRVKKTTRTLKDEPQPPDIKPGIDAGGQQAIKKMFPEPDVKDRNKQVNPYDYIQHTYGGLSGVSFFGPLFGIAIKTLSGDKPDKIDYRNASIGLSNWAIASFGSVGIPGFANGGMVGIGGITDPNELTRAVEKSLEDRISGEVDKAINDLKRRLGLKPIVGGGGQTPSSVTGPVTGLQGQAKEYYEYLVSKGVSPNHAMGLVLNIARESSFQPGVEIIDVNGKPSGGLFQWNAGRFANMVKAVPDWKTNWKGQLDYAMQESDPTSGGFAAYKSQNFATPMEAATWWLEKWERGDNVPRDVAKMQKILDGWISSGMKQSPAGQFQFPAFEPKGGYKPKTPGLFNAVQYITGDPSQGANYEYAGHGTTDNYHDHIAFATEADKEKAKTALRAAGIQIGSELRPGDPGYHGANLAIDIPGGQWKGSGAIGQKEYDGSAKVRKVLGLFGGGPTGKGGLILTHGGEYVHDKDSVDAFGQPFMDIVNQVENVTQRKGAAIALMNILKNYIPEYDSRYEKTVVIPVPQPQMVPVPIPSGGGGGISVMNQSQPSGRTDILNSGS